MKGIVKKIHKEKRSRNGNRYIRVEFKVENGAWAKTDLCPDYANFQRWRPILEEGKGTHLKGLKLRTEKSVDADSYPRIIAPFPEEEGDKQLRF